MLISMNTFVIIIFKLKNQCSSLPGSFAFQEKKNKTKPSMHLCINKTFTIYHQVMYIYHYTYTSRS